MCHIENPAFDFTPKGWECPRCGRINSPSMPFCWCKPQTTVFAPTTGTPPDHLKYPNTSKTK